MKTINELHDQWEKTGKCIFCSKGKLKGFVVDKQDDNDDELFLNEKSIKGFYDVEKIFEEENILEIYDDIESMKVVGEQE